MQNYEQYPASSEELQHYGVLGMKWGVRRASKRLSQATTKEGRDKAVASLNKHKTKGTAKVAKLNAKNDKLSRKADKLDSKNAARAAKLKQKAAKYDRKSYGRFVSQSKYEKLQYKAKSYTARANNLLAYSNTVKARIESNNAMISLYNRELKNIDTALASQGRKIVDSIS